MCADKHASSPSLPYRRVYRVERADWAATVQLLIFTIIAAAGLVLAISFVLHLRDGDATTPKAAAEDVYAIVFSVGTFVVVGVLMIRKWLVLVERHRERMERMERRFPPAASPVPTELPDFLRRK